MFCADRQNTAPMASFTGSMQLMAGVKLCTGRPVNNHPHYEDKELRRKTKQVNKATVQVIVPLAASRLLFDFCR